MSFSIKEKIKTVVKLFFEPKVIYSLISFRAFGYLLQTGWFSSLKLGEPVDAELKPLPWFTYSALDFLREKLNFNISVLEFGCGNSTLFFADRVNKVFSIEHNKHWYNKIFSKITSNVELIHTPNETIEQYIKPIITARQKFDIIVVDGLYRNECLKESINYITENGVIILDDSERNDYNEGTTFLLKNGFRVLNFTGIAPGIFFRKCTTVFYRNKNCLNI